MFGLQESKFPGRFEFFFLMMVHSWSRERIGIINSCYGMALSCG